jgi:uncharacterized protein with FMN-binding domain
LRRAPIVVTATVAGLVAVLNFKPHEPALPTAKASTATPAGSGSSSTASSSASKATTTTAGSKVVTGDAISTRYGNAQVRVTIKNGKITNIVALQLQGNDPKSVQISGGAEPTLKAEALQKQSAAIDTVSGATITSASYEASLQSALDKAGFKAADGSRGTTTVPDVPEQADHGGWSDDDDGGVAPGFTAPQG